jgi:outer membrane autotransporter protein
MRRPTSILASSGSGSIKLRIDEQPAGGRNALEKLYDPALTGPYANLLLQMFTFNTDAGIAGAYDQLSGVEYPHILHAVRNNSFVLNSFVSDQIDCAIHIRGLEECRTPTTRGRVWIKGSYNWADVDSNANFIGYDANSWSAMIGGDFQFGHASLARLPVTAISTSTIRTRSSAAAPKLTASSLVSTEPMTSETSTPAA